MALGSNSSLLLYKGVSPHNKGGVEAWYLGGPTWHYTAGLIAYCCSSMLPLHSRKPYSWEGIACVSHDGSLDMAVLFPVD